MKRGFLSNGLSHATQVSSSDSMKATPIASSEVHVSTSSLTARTNVSDEVKTGDPYQDKWLKDVKPLRGSVSKPIEHSAAFTAHLTELEKCVEDVSLKACTTPSLEMDRLQGFMERLKSKEKLKESVPLKIVVRACYKTWLADPEFRRELQIDEIPN